ncbi:hypothetical protein ACFVTT_28390 [Streptomyces niveus]|uniref:hypothetical protein n=1 Tax=Streptomyces niveus TaxID=193462 RepID=UPI00343A2B0E
MTTRRHSAARTGVVGLAVAATAATAFTAPAAQASTGRTGPGRRRTGRRPWRRECAEAR